MNFDWTIHFSHHCLVLSFNTHLSFRSFLVFVLCSWIFNVISFVFCFDFDDRFAFIPFLLRFIHIAIFFFFSFFEKGVLFVCVLSCLILWSSSCLIVIYSRGFFCCLIFISMDSNVINHWWSIANAIQIQNSLTRRLLHVAHINELQINHQKCMTITTNIVTADGFYDHRSKTFWSWLHWLRTDMEQCIFFIVFFNIHAMHDMKNRRRSAICYRI